MSFTFPNVVNYLTAGFYYLTADCTIPGPAEGICSYMTAE